MKRKKLIIISILLLSFIILLGVGSYHTYTWWNETYIKINDVVMRRDITELDLHSQPLPPMEDISQLSNLETLIITDTGLTEQQYELLHANLPTCNIIWSIPFQSKYLSMDTTCLSLSTISNEDISTLNYFPNLTALDVTACSDNSLVVQLLNTYPDLQINYNLTIGSTKVSHIDTQATLEDANPTQVTEVLPYLPSLAEITFTGNVPGNEQILQWIQQYPNIKFIWTFDVFGVPASSIDTELILNNIPISSTEEVEAFFPYFYDLQRVEMCNCGLPSEELDALWKRNPETRIIWNIFVGKCELRTDDIAFMPYHFGYKDGSQINDADAVELKYCVDIICMDIGHMAISDYSFLEYMPNMQYLIIADTDGTDFSVLSTLKELKYLEVFMTRFNQAEVLTGLTKLEDLNIGTSQIDNIEPLKQMTWLKNLWLPACVKVNATERRELYAALPDTNVMFLGAGSTGNGWRKLPNYFEMRDILDMPYKGGW